MNNRDFAGLLQGVKELAAHMRGQVVPGVINTRPPDPDACSIREAADVNQREQRRDRAMERVLNITIGDDWIASLRAGAARAVASGEYVGESINFESPEAFRSKLSDKRWQLVKALQGAGEVGVLELSRRVGRDVNSVREDAAALVELGLFEKTPRGDLLCPYANIHVDKAVYCTRNLQLESFVGWQDRWPFDPDWRIEEAFLEQLRWHREGRPDGRTRGPFQAWSSAQWLKECEQRFRKGKKQAVLDGMYLCMLDELPVPEWLSAAFIGAYQSVTQYAAKGWSDVFGSAHKKGTNLAAQRKRLDLAPKLYMLAAEILAFHPETAIDDGFYESVGKEFNVGKTLAQEYISAYCKATGSSIHDFRALPRKDREDCGSS